MRIVIEGLWALGKTSICKFLKKDYGFSFIKEPDHKKRKVNNIDLDYWYYDKHIENLEKAIKTVNTNVVLERSAASTLAFIKSRDGKPQLAKKLITDRRFLKYRRLDLCIILKISYKDYLMRLRSSRNRGLKKFILSNKNLVRNYNRNLKFYCELLFGKKKVKTINVFKDKSSIKNHLIKKLLKW